MVVGFVAIFFFFLIIILSRATVSPNAQRRGLLGLSPAAGHHKLYCFLQALIRFKNFFYFEEKDDPVDEYEKVTNVIITLVMW